MRISFYSLIIISVLLVSCTGNHIKIACIGDSITEGYGLKVQSQSSYPSILNLLTGDDTLVLNLGRSATTMNRKGDFPYWTAKEFSNIFAFQPDIIIIKLGTNDTKPQNWNEKAFKLSYQAMIDTLCTLSTNPEIWLCKPVPVFETKWGINDSTIVMGVIPIVDEIAKNNNLWVIDLYNSMIDDGGLFPDGIHPNEVGTKKMADIVYHTIRK